MSRNVCAVAQFIVLSCFLLIGCKGSGRPTIAPVRGTVTYHGRPVADATVVFLCQGAPRLAVGKTDAQGNYQLTTYESNDGAVLGNHVVTVKKYKENAGHAGENAVNVENMDEASRSKAIEKAMRQSAQEVSKAEKSGSLLPAKYANMKTSDLHKEVVSGRNVIDLNLPD